MKLNQFVNHANEGFRYLIVGGMTTLINLLVYQIGLWLGIGYLVATTFAFTASVIFAFFANKYYVFKKVTPKGIWRELMIFAGSRISTFLIETIGLIVWISVLAVQEMLAKLIMNIIVIVLNYIISKFWIFKGEKCEENRES
ncbi:GtrA family protein [Fusibacter ferrireducens]|uniref:GtrA family protein n=1 Tax=Fusibacter ferrireducens TaxID=2785058 RepID=A0ABR9ZVT3_9FIRM|nr:GtrA family protein [Fusibacter ferrireducens]MBF4694572.1 GtrA family protein [Fusibacter ferrireducens]